VAYADKLKFWSKFIAAHDIHGITSLDELLEEYGGKRIAYDKNMNIVDKSDGYYFALQFGTEEQAMIFKLKYV
jgi:hypothetical protein